MLKLNLVLAAVAAAALALPAVAATSVDQGSGEAKMKVGEPIVVEASRFGALPGDPAFAFTGAEGGWEVVQHSYGRIDGRFGHTDKLVHSDAPFVRYTTAEAMGIVPMYPGA